MATRSAIGVMHGNVIKAVYCHWDGYLEHNGAILQEHYDSAKANNLVALGQISSLGKEIGVKHHFSQYDSNMSKEEYESLYGDMTTFYGRDRGEKDCSWKVFDNYKSFVDYFEGSGCEYFYIMQDSAWYYSTCNNNELRLVSEGLKVAA